MKTMILSGHDYQAEVQIKSPMGWISAQGSITILSETAFSGSVKLMGFTAELTDCARDGAHLCFTASPKLPFGVLRVEIEADVADDGTVTGIVNAPRHKPMEIRGRITPVSAANHV